jgi:hypothetical protein
MADSHDIDVFLDSPGRCTACAPKQMRPREITTLVDQKNPGSKPWMAPDREGQGTPCDVDGNRRHWILEEKP